ncbi:hypothetical protein ASO14_95 [Kurthia sp. 11kri321]|uniref:hypothetical protein n=1 Tax=Kurthia sp. 11kri321 TaxID=1750719 RepID=UPI000745EF30|nr:hypothetical protein [Kurthia sp. 11kri321]AMA63447.1 hypothetical protein ASO14_95 [Kurthia sp. 11kri321]
MDYLFLDEKGTQNTIKALDDKELYSDSQKIQLGTDNMKTFVSSVVKISGENIEGLEKEYTVVEQNYLNERQQSQKIIDEVKGALILKRNFEYGAASMNKKAIAFYSELLDLLKKYQVQHHLFAVNKIPLAIDKRFKDWILSIAEKTKQPFANIILYSLSKYASIEASEKVIKALFNREVSDEEVLGLIINDIKAFILKYDKPTPNRLTIQIANYKSLLEIFNRFKDVLISKSYEDSKFITFNWKKAVFTIDLWLIELQIDRSNLKLRLDNGIDSKYFEELNLLEVQEGLDSKMYPGLRIADVLVVFIGGYISKMSGKIMYNKEQPFESRYLPMEFFQLKKEQFELLIKLKDYLFNTRLQYSYTNDLYFDDTEVFKTFLEYLGTFSSFEEFKAINFNSHSLEHFKMLAVVAQKKYEEMVQNEFCAISISGSLKKAITSGLVRP